MKVVIPHHWFVSMRGGERVVEQLCRLFPDAELLALVARRERLSSLLQNRPLRTSLLQHVGGAVLYKKMLPLFPEAVGRLSVPVGTDLVLSSDAAVIKGVRVPEGVPHVCYCHSPPRYLWDLHESYVRQTSGLGPVGRLLFRKTMPRLREFDQRAAQRVNWFIANSEFVRKRIKDAYGREAVVIHPPVEVDAFDSVKTREDFYLVVSELTAYKRVDLAVEACTRLGRELVVVGDGAEAETLRRKAGPTVRFLGRQSFACLKDLLETCAALIHPQIEDFGITAVEAQAAGAPVIALEAGGALETIVDGRTGVFFREQETESLCDAVLRFEASRSAFSPAQLRANALRFDERVFRSRMKEQLAQWVPEILARRTWPE